MAHRTKFRHLRTGLLPILFGVLSAGGLLLGAQPAAAVDNCIQDVWKAHGNTQNLTCTANDVRIAGATNIVITSGGSCTGTPPNQVCTCNSPGNVTFTADYTVVLGAQTRYDIGLYFGTDGDPNNNGALTGQCQAAIITASEEVPPSTFAQLDGDVCGDIDQAHNPQLLNISLTVPCVGDPVTGKLKLPNCTSWRQPGSNGVCSGIGNGTTTNDAFPGSPSKCNCQPGFTIDILVEHPTISVEKTVVPTQVNEPGGTVTYTVHVTNNGSQATVTLTALTEDDTNDGTVDFTYNASSSPTLASICGTTTLGPGASTDCTFTRTVSGNAGDNITDKACVSGTDSNGGTVTPVCDTATVSIADVKPTAAVTKTVDSVVCAVIRYKVKVENTDLVESLDLTALTDDKVGGNGDITTVHDGVVATTCSVPQTIVVGGKYECTFDANVCTFPDTDTVTGTLNDNDGNTITPSGSATVTSVTAN
jgi:hypothetical protein